MVDRDPEVEVIVDCGNCGVMLLSPLLVVLPGLLSEVLVPMTLNERNELIGPLELLGFKLLKLLKEL